MCVFSVSVKNGEVDLLVALGVGNMPGVDFSSAGKAGPVFTMEPNARVDDVAAKYFRQPIHNFYIKAIVKVLSDDAMLFAVTNPYNTVSFGMRLQSFNQGSRKRTRLYVYYTTNHQSSLPSTYTMEVDDMLNKWSQLDIIVNNNAMEVSLDCQFMNTNDLMSHDRLDFAAGSKLYIGRQGMPDKYEFKV